MLQRYVSKIYIDEKGKKNISNFSQMENFKRKRRFVVNIRHLSPKNYYIVDEERRNEGFFPFFPPPRFSFSLITGKRERQHGGSN